MGTAVELARCMGPVSAEMNMRVAAGIRPVSCLAPAQVLLDQAPALVRERDDPPKSRKVVEQFAGRTQDAGQDSAEQQPRITAEVTQRPAEMKKCSCLGTNFANLD